MQEPAPATASARHDLIGATATGQRQTAAATSAADQAPLEAHAAAIGHMQEPTPATASTRHDMIGAAATGQRQTAAATNAADQTPMEARPSATGHTRTDGKPLLDPPELDDDAGPTRDTDEIPGWTPGACPSSFQNETGDP